jgi:probable rRNA maturation factor
MDRERVGEIAVEVSDAQPHLRVEPAWLAGLARGVLEREGVARATISVALVDDATIHELNRRHLGHDWPTDVISFVLSEPGEVLAGELVISAEMAAATAREAGVDPAAELALYLVHGLLHLCGYDDRDAAAAEAMRRKEEEALAAAGLPNTFAKAGAAGPGRGS